MSKVKNHSSKSHAGSNFSAARPTSARARMDNINARNESESDEEMALRRKLVPRLAKRAFHLEDENTWCQDWVQYQRNTHPVFGLCMYHRFHPIRLPQRVIILLGSLACGFAITNCVYLGFLGKETAGDQVSSIYEATGKLAAYQQQYTNIEVEQSLVFLLTVGSFLHSMFDMSIWYLMACFCFRPGGCCQRNVDNKFGVFCQKFGIYVGVMVVGITVSAATAVAVLRLNQGEQEKEATDAEQSDKASEQFAEDNILDESTNQFSFLVGYALEMVFALFIFYFLTSTVAFSGILGCCGRIPVLGGRPYEIKKGKTSNGNDESEEYEEGRMQAYNV